MFEPTTVQPLYIAGHQGMVGRALVRKLKQSNYSSLLLRTSSQLNLVNQAATRKFFAENTPEIVIVAAAKVGGIEANRAQPADFCYQNLQIACNVIEAAHEFKTARLLFLGSSCIYPKNANQPISEEEILTGPLEATNEAYALAKIAGLKLCQFYREQHGDLFHTAMPCNLYGPGDNYHPEHSHVIPALIRRFHEAKEASRPNVAIWGTGTPMREFLHVDDLASACLKLLQIKNPPNLINIGSDEEISIIDLAHLVSETIGYKGNICCDTERPDGTMRKLMSSAKIREFGWKPEISLEAGLCAAYQSFLKENL